MKINQPIILNKTTVKNRIVMPPLVCFNWADQNGYETYDRKEHYGSRTSTGLIVIEATAISPSGRLSDTELGLWEDGHIPQFKKIAEVCHEDQTVCLVQLVHAGFQGITSPLYSASKDNHPQRKVYALSLDQIKEIKDDFVQASVRAYKAGLDGIEIHGAHTYLINQFTSSTTNFREDCYGGSPENRMRLPLEIVEEVRKATSEDFIIGYRFGVNSSDFQEDIMLLQALDKAGVDFFDVSSGFIPTDFDLPEDFPFSTITYLGVKLQEYTNKPVACVYGITQGIQAETLIDQYGVQMVAVGKAILADPKWAEKAISEIEIDPCYQCKPKCLYSKDGRKCPQYIKRDKKQ
ncbi:MAG: NADH:flavin oxidoreductase [Clostridia bacterium]|nr:NADH:flavin oxidoreductase [Clostridia bacterium]